MKHQKIINWHVLTWVKYNRKIINYICRIMKIALLLI
jgi:hypothetical protein